MVLNVLGKRMAADLHWGENRKDFYVIGKATDPKAVAHVQGRFNADNVSEFSFTMPYGYSPPRFHAGLLRSAYLILFRTFGYRYACQPIVQQLRLRIHDPNLTEPDLGAMIVELKDFDPSVDKSYFVLPYEIYERQFYFVIIRLKRKTTSHLGVYMPAFECDDVATFLETLDRHKQVADGKRTSVSIVGPVYCG